VGVVAVSIEIDAPPQRVWAVLEPIERHVDWMADAESIAFVDGQRRGIGTRFVCVTKIGPITLQDRMEITSWAPGREMGVRHSGLVTGTGRFTLTPIDLERRTRFAWTEDLQFPWWLGGRLGSRVGGATVLKAIWRRNLRRLRRIVETGSP
jgi:hypothetical protein